MHQERQLIEPGFVYRYLLGALPDRVSGSRTGGRRRDNGDVEFVPGDVERIFSLGPKKQAPDDSHHRMLALSNRSLNQSTIFAFIPNR